MPHVSFIGNEEQRLVKRLQEGPDFGGFNISEGMTRWKPR